MYPHLFPCVCVSVYFRIYSTLQVVIGYKLIPLALIGYYHLVAAHARTLRAPARASSLSRARGRKRGKEQEREHAGSENLALLRC